MSDLPAGWLNVKLGEIIDYADTLKVEPSDISDDAWVLELEDIEKKSSKLIKKITYSERQV